jgi:hypothetical protein
MKKFVWCSVHQISEAQTQELQKMGMVELEVLPTELQSRINNCPDNVGGLNALCDDLKKHLGAKYGYNNHNLHLVQLGGSPMFRSMFGAKFLYQGHNEQGAPWKLCDAYSQRISEDIPQTDGSVKKVAVFRHKHFIVW